LESQVKGIGREFIEKTKYHHLDPSDQTRGVPPPPVELGQKSGERLLALPDPAIVPASDVHVLEAMNRRVSVRQYTQKALSQEELSSLLWYTQGVKEIVQGYVTLRTVPSAGARHAFESYLLINRVAGLNPGLYRYLATKHGIIPTDLGDESADSITAACFGQDFVKTSAVTFIWTAVVYRMTWRYGQRGYRYLFLDAGHLCQNLYIAAESIGCGVCAIGAFSDDEMNRLLGLDGVEQFVIYLAAVGKKLVEGRK
jgi:SagB-type dehydrogenase family enzyme